jgi:MFS family permease
MVGAVGSIMNFFNNLAGIAAPIVAGFIFESTHSFAANFLVAGAILVIGIICFLVLLRRIEPIQMPQIGPEAGLVTSTD